MPTQVWELDNSLSIWHRKRLQHRRFIYDHLQHHRQLLQSAISWKLGDSRNLWDPIAHYGWWGGFCLQLYINRKPMSAQLRWKTSSWSLVVITMDWWRQKAEQLGDKSLAVFPSALNKKIYLMEHALALVAAKFPFPRVFRKSQLKWKGYIMMVQISHRGNVATPSWLIPRASTFVGPLIFRSLGSQIGWKPAFPLCGTGLSQTTRAGKLNATTLPKRVNKIPVA